MRTDGAADEYDVVVVGGGTGGLSAAREAVRRGASTLLVQEGRLGGDCTFTGCVPSKALLAAAARGDSFSEAMAQVHRAVEAIAATEDDAALRRTGVEVLHGRGVFRSPTLLSVGGTSIRSQRFVIATGAGPVVPPIEGVREADPLTNENLFDVERQPRRLAVLGGGAIGAEMSQAFARLGTQVTLIEAENRILTKEEPEASQVLAEALGAGGVCIRTGGKVNKVEVVDGATRVHIDGGEPVEVDRVLVAIGRKPSTSNMGLDDIGVDLDERGFIRTDDTMATSVPGIWAVGDVAGSLQFTHAANRMAFVAVRNALSRWAKVHKQRFEAGQVPWATFTSPEIGRVGMTEAEAVDHGGRVAYLPMTEVDRAVATGETRGFIKLIAGAAPHPAGNRRRAPARGHGRRRGGRGARPRGGTRHAHQHVHRPAGPDRTHLPDVVDGGAEGGGAVLLRGRWPRGEAGPEVSPMVRVPTARSTRRVTMRFWPRSVRCTEYLSVMSTRRARWSAVTSRPARCSVPPPRPIHATDDGIVLYRATDRPHSQCQRREYQSAEAVRLVKRAKPASRTIHY